MGRHLFLDVAVTDAASGGALDARPSSAASCGVAAARRALQKTQKYGPLAAGVSSDFCPAVMERLGTMCDELAGLIRMLCGDGERDRMRHDDVTFSHSSRSTYMAGMIGLAVVVADAMMLDTVLGLDVRGDDARATPGAPRVGRELGGEVHGWFEYIARWSLHRSSGRWRVVVVPSGTRCPTSQLWTGGPFSLLQPCCCCCCCPCV